MKILIPTICNNITQLGYFVPGLCLESLYLYFTFVLDPFPKFLDPMGAIDNPQLTSEGLVTQKASIAYMASIAVPLCALKDTLIEVLML